MENLIIEATAFTPEIHLDGEMNVISVEGKSYPENTAEFYAPVFSWLEHYFSRKNPDFIMVNFNVAYFNSSSSKVFLDLFDMFESEANNGKKIIINWMYEQDDKDNLEFGEEFQEEYKTLKFNIVQKR